MRAGTPLLLVEAGLPDWDGARVSRRTTQVVAALLLAALLICAAIPAAARTRKQPVTALSGDQPRVVVLMAPYLSWDDVNAESMPHLAQFADTAVLGNMNVRAGAVTGGSSPEKGALVLSAGAPLEFALGALSAFDASETVGETKARDLYQQYYGVSRGTSSVLYLGLPRQVFANAETQFGNRIGSLGAAVHAAGLKTAALGSADLGYVVAPEFAMRPAGLAAADETGRVDYGSVSNSTLIRDAVAPYGVMSSTSVLLANYNEIMSNKLAHFIVVDPGDLERVQEAQSSITTSAAEAARLQALRSTDELVAGMQEALEKSDVLIVMSQAVPSPTDTPAGFGPVIIGGPVEPGLGVAASTHRDGIVTTYDIAATILRYLGASQPPNIVGSRIATGKTLAGAPLEDRISYLNDLNKTAVAVESVRMPTVNTFIVIAVIILIISTLLLYRGSNGLPGWAFRVARSAVLLLECVLLGSVIQFVFWLRPPSGVLVLALLALATVLSFAVIVLVSRNRVATLPLVLAMALVSLAIMIDQWVGAPLSYIQIFGYSPLLGARYYGLGNEMAGVLLGSIMMAAVVAIDTWRESAFARHMRLWGWPLLGVITLATTTLPGFGANVGAVAWMTVGFLVGWMVLNGRKVWTWQNVVAVIVIVVLVVAGLALVDVSGIAGSETHLGRAVSDITHGGVSGVWTMIVRKAETNVRVLGRTNWTWMLLAVLLLLGYMRWRPHGEFAELLKANPAFSAGLAAALFAGTVGYFTEDSGIIIPALMFVPVGVAALYLMLERHHGSEAS